MADHTHSTSTPLSTSSTSFRTATFEITTGNREVALDITDRCARFLDEHAVGRDGLLNVFVPHATAGIAVLETGSGSDEDFLATLRELLPADDRWRHRHGSPGHGRDHVVPALVAPHATLPVIGGRLALGVWQSVVLVDTNGDNPRRTLRLSFLG
ncbi:secondary thiamine-phosphate synthase enzyme YjbQ [Kitasatospora sp. NPDC093806]|uniref:secondary thiamine-phosphate synthase enzyme YjbQ n=1 Tax=Kitasatospora sp. NPDC093806 TaxID=3155075 RepID=UPI00341C6FF8